MYLWVFPNEIQRYIDQTFTSVPSGIFQNLGGHFLKSAFALWQVRIKNCIFFCSVLTGCSTNALSNPLGIRPEVLALACEDMRQGVIAGRVDLTRAAVYRILRRHAATGTLVPSPWGSPEDFTWSRPCFVEDVPIGSLLLRPWRLGWGICMEWGLAGKLSTTGFFPMVTVHIDQRGCPCWLPTTLFSARSRHRGGRTWW